MLSASRRVLLVLTDDVVHDGYAVRCEHLVVRIGRRQVLDDVSLALGSGVVSDVGVNGSGKTTLLQVLATLRRPSGGAVSVGGTSLRARRGLAAARRATGYLAQYPVHHAHLPVLEARREDDAEEGEDEHGAGAHEHDQDDGPGCCVRVSRPHRRRHLHTWWIDRRATLLVRNRFGTDPSG